MLLLLLLLFILLIMAILKVFSHIVFLIQFIFLIIPIILTVALFTLLERKILASIQRRRGPNVVGRWGLLQPFADAFKLIFNETIVPGVANTYLFLIVPVITFLCSYVNWALMPFDYGVVLVDINLGLMSIFVFSSLGVYGVILSGWASNSKYALLGGIRSTAQMIAYEVSLGLIIMMVVVITGTINLTGVVLFQENLWFMFFFFPVFLLFFIIALAETNRVPFDLPEAESELVSGYNVEYSAITFALFFLAEYSSILIMSFLMAIFFLGGWLGPIFPGYFWMTLKVCCFVFLFVLIRGTVPRYRYDQLMLLGWKVILPIVLCLYFLIVIVFYFFSYFMITDLVIITDYLDILV